MTHSFRGVFAVLTLMLVSQAGHAQEISDGPRQATSHKSLFAELGVAGAVAGAAAAFAELGHGAAHTALQTPHAEQPQPSKTPSPVRAPEISTTGLPASVALLAGAVCIVQGRRRAED